MTGNVPIYVGVFGYESSSFKLALSKPGDPVDPAELADATIQPGDSIDTSLDQGEWLFLKVENPDGVSDSLAKIDNLINDIDLYVQYDALPTRSTYACRSFLADIATERCQIDLSSGRTAYIGAFGYRNSPLTLSLSSTQSGGPSTMIETIEPGQSDVRSLDGADFVYYEVANPENVAVSVLSLRNLTTDMDLFTRVGAPPTSNVYDCMSALSSTQRESCSIDLANAAGTVFVGVQSNDAGMFELTLSDSSSGVGDNYGEIKPGDSLNGDLTADQWMYYEVKNTEGMTNIMAKLDNLNDDLDLFIRNGALPTTTDYDCVSQAAGSEPEACEVIPNPNSTTFIGVFGVDNETFTLSLVADPLVLGAALSNEPPGTRISEDAKVFAGKWNYYEVIINDSEDTLFASVSNSELPANLFVKRGNNPSLDDYDCGPFIYTGKDNNCEQIVSVGETWYIGIFSEQGTSYELKVNTSGIDPSGNSTTGGGTTDGGLAGTGSVSTGGGTVFLLLSILLIAILWRFAVLSEQANRRNL